ncbi:hypothetical protein [Bradyrhizobium prioriisuperbiae]|nr:hypothetical protein [Bradyrhizobium prioritasuperba]
MWRSIEAWLGRSDAQLVELGIDATFAILLSLIVTTGLRLVIEFL